MVDQEWFEKNGKPVNVYVPVKDTNAALLALGKGYAAKFRIPKMAVTGSNGKTTTKDMIVRVLSQVGPHPGHPGQLQQPRGRAAHPVRAQEGPQVRRHRDGHQPSRRNPGPLRMRPAHRRRDHQYRRQPPGAFRQPGEGAGREADHHRRHPGQGRAHPQRGRPPAVGGARPASRYKLLTYGIDRGQVRPDDLAFGAGRLRQLPHRPHPVPASACRAATTCTTPWPPSPWASITASPRPASPRPWRDSRASKNRLQVKRLSGHHRHRRLLQRQPVLDQDPPWPPWAPSRSRAAASP